MLFIYYVFTITWIVDILTYRSSRSTNLLSFFPVPSILRLTLSPQNPGFLSFSSRLLFTVIPDYIPHKTFLFFFFSNFNPTLYLLAISPVLFIAPLFSSSSWNLFNILTPLCNVFSRVHTYTYIYLSVRLYIYLYIYLYII